MARVVPAKEEIPKGQVIGWSFRPLKIRIGTMDLKIAAIVKGRSATLLSRKLVDFKEFPGLKVEDRTS